MVIDFKDETFSPDNLTLEEKVDFSFLINNLKSLQIKSETIESSYWTFNGLLQDVHNYPVPKKFKEESKGKWGMFVSNGMLPLIYNKDEQKFVIGIRGQDEELEGELRRAVDIGVRLEDNILPYLELDESIKIDYILLTNNQYRSLVSLVQNDELRRKSLGEFDEDTDARKAFFALVATAVNKRASDIHIETGVDKKGKEINRVRYRIDGNLQEDRRVPGNRYNAIVNVTKILTNGDMDITLHDIPQDGKIKFNFEDDEIPQHIKDYELRVSTFPTSHGEKVALRILRSQKHMRTLEKLGFFSNDCQTIREMSHSPNGIILITGPTGSGKTSTLYSIIHERNKSDVNITTIEDPIEIEINGINQTEVNEKRGYGFSNMLRHAVRQDPDIILVGEIRDRETAELAVNASQTGHLVFSTLHTNDATASLIRLYELGVESSLLEESLIGVVAQRLARKLCFNCKKDYDASSELNELFREKIVKSPFYIYSANENGCPNCIQGYSDRTVISEIWVIGKNEKDLISQGCKSHSEYLKSAIQGGMKPLVFNGLENVINGTTSLEEIRKKVVRVNDFRNHKTILLPLMETIKLDNE